MQLLSILPSLALVSAVASFPHAAPASLFARAPEADRGNETIAGLGERKQAVQSAGGNTRDLAIAMLET